MIYICIPTHNEQQTVGVVLWKLRQVLTEFPRDYQLLVADDASTDKTLDVLEPYTRVLPLTVIRSEERQGQAASLEMLLREAVRRSEYPKRDVIVTLQADFSDEPDDVIALIKRMEAGADVALGVKVSNAPQPRMRRLAWALSRFFTRRQGWPEGVTTPFDGFRAYRLYAVKRAIEDRGERRLVSYDGWAGQAELLRAVLPHARRVDPVEVEDRTDRMQRPRRERPFAAAMQVRAMAGGAEPGGLRSTAELDRIAATTSRSRDRAVARQNGDGRARGNGAGTRDRRPEQSRARPDRSRSEGSRGDSGRENRQGGAARSQGGGRGERAQRPVNGGAETGQEPRRRGRAEATQEGAEGSATQAPRRERSRKPPGERAPRRQREPGGATAGNTEPGEPQAHAPQPQAGTAELQAELELLLASVSGDGGTAGTTEGEGETARPKKRRRRRRSKGGAAGAASAEAGTDIGEDGSGPGDEGFDAETRQRAPSDDAAEDVTDESPDAVEGGAGEKKRRRRGGRRGGRGRRRGPRAEGADGLGDEGGTSDSGGGDTEGGIGVPDAGPREEPAHRTDAAAAASPDGEGDRN